MRSFFIFYDFGKFRLDVENEQLYKDSEPVLLTQKAFLILCLLLENAGQLIKKETLINEIWDGSFVEDANITQQIYILRKTLGNNEAGKPFIETLPKRGYCFIGEVQKIADKKAKPNQENDLPPQINSTRPKTSYNKFILSGAAILSVLIIFIASFVSQNGKNAAETNSIKSIAVLPFKQIGEAADDSKIGFGLADAVINNLSKQQKIPVRSMGSVFGYANQVNVDAVQAGKRLEVDSVLEGTVQQEGEQVRVSLRLIKTSDGSTLWAETFNEKFDHIFTLQDSISNKVAQSLSMNLSGWEKPLIAQQPANPEAFQFYQLGVYFSNIKTEESLQRAISYFQKVIELDSNYAPAYAMLADSYNWLNEFGSGARREELLTKSEEAAQKALSLDNTLAEAHIAIAFVQFVKNKDYEAGKNSVERAVKLSPYNAIARLHYGWELLQRGDLEGGYRQTVLAQEYSPLSIPININLCNFLIFKKEYPQAFNACKKVAELQPSTPLINIQIANILFLMNRSDEAINLLKLESQNPSGKYAALGSLAYIYAKTGKLSEAEKIYSQLKEHKDDYLKFSNLALLSFTLGKKEEVSGNLQKMIETSAIPPTFLTFDPFWEEISKTPDFQQIISRK